MKKCIVKDCEKMAFSGTDVCSGCLEILNSEGIKKDLKQFLVEDGECAQEILSAVVYPQIDIDGEIVWRGIVESQETHSSLFNEISGKTKLEVVINLSIALSAYIDRLIALRRKIDVKASETL